MRTLAAVGLAVLVGGCHVVLDPSRHEARDAGPSRRDAGPVRDAGARDGGPRDGDVGGDAAPRPCTTDDACGPSTVSFCHPVDGICVACPPGMLQGAPDDTGWLTDVRPGTLEPPLALTTSDGRAHVIWRFREGEPQERLFVQLASPPAAPPEGGPTPAPHGPLTDRWTEVSEPAAVAARRFDDGVARLAVLHADGPELLAWGPLPAPAEAPLAPSRPPVARDRGAWAVEPRLVVVGSATEGAALVWAESDGTDTRLAHWREGEAGAEIGPTVGDARWLSGSAGAWGAAPGSSDDEVRLFAPGSGAVASWPTPGRTTRARLALVADDRYLLAWAAGARAVLQPLRCGASACEADGPARSVETLGALRLPALVSLPRGAALVARASVDGGQLVALYFDDSLAFFPVGDSPDGVHRVADLASPRDLAAAWDPDGARLLVSALRAGEPYSTLFQRIGGCR
ncbi:MAG TPA: hypothetical protein RMH99_02620 [Sandaracinaceae bacterium LLY-WYZ-13_1]|nr:hypothetical protein [Sandaracinaceae bacterium LLY-WYZ-13_1]